MKEMRERFFVLTGGPGSGKTTLADALRKQSVACVPEAGRRIIQTQREIGGRGLPWLDPAHYAEIEFGAGLVAFCEADAGLLTIFDRGILDPIGFLTVSKLVVPRHMHEAARTYRYNRKVFIAPPWKEIYTQDEEREQSFELARATHDAMARVYEEAGYDLVRLPEDSVEARVAFVLATIAAAPAT